MQSSTCSLGPRSLATSGGASVVWLDIGLFLWRLREKALPCAVGIVSLDESVDECSRICRQGVSHRDREVDGSCWPSKRSTLLRSPLSTLQERARKYLSKALNGQRVWAGFVNDV